MASELIRAIWNNGCQDGELWDGNISESKHCIVHNINMKLGTNIRDQGWESHPFEMNINTMMSPPPEARIAQPCSSHYRTSHQSQRISSMLPYSLNSIRLTAVIYIGPIMHHFDV